MRPIRIVLSALCVWLAACLWPAHPGAWGEESQSLGEVLTDLLSGTESDLPTAGPDRRIPFSKEEIQLSFAPLVTKTAPAVVNVYASQRAPDVRSPFAGDPFFEQFFGRRTRRREQNSLGSGVLVDASGVVVTNFHVIGGADQVKVATSDGREFASRVLLQDESLDLAILKIDATGLRRKWTRKNPYE